MQQQIKKEKRKLILKRLSGYIFIFAFIIYKMLEIDRVHSASFVVYLYLGILIVSILGYFFLFQYKDIECLVMNKFDIVEDIIATNIEYYDHERALTWQAKPWYEIFLPDRHVTFDKTHSTYIGYFTNFKPGEEVILFVNNDLEKPKILHVFYKNNKMTD